MSLLLPWQQQPASNDVSVNAEVATGTGTAYTASVDVQPNAGTGAGTGAAYGSSPSEAPSAGIATGTGAANTASVSIEVNAGAATGTGAAYGSIPSGAVSAGTASGIGGVVGAFQGFQPDAFETPASVGIGVNAGLASGTGQAYDATVTTPASLSVTAGSASGLGAAFDATVIIAVGAGFAAGTGQAYDATISATTGGAAGGWGKLQAKRKRAARLPQPVRAPTLVYALAETATGYGQAFDATVRIDWTLDEWLLGLTDDQLIDTATRGGVA